MLPHGQTKHPLRAGRAKAPTNDALLGSRGCVGLISISLVGSTGPGT